MNADQRLVVRLFFYVPPGKVVSDAEIAQMAARQLKRSFQKLNHIILAERKHDWGGAPDYFEVFADVSPLDLREAAEEVRRQNFELAENEP